MQWLSIASAWFALSCLIIVAMYILKKRYEPRSISSHLLWRRALQEQEANKPWQRLKQRLLLWLQLLAALLIVLGLMEPVIEKQLTEDSHVVLLLDRSSSMVTTSAYNQDETYFNRAKQDMLRWIDQQYDGGAVTLITNGDYPEILLNRAQRKGEIEQAIRAVTPYYGVSDDETVLSLARALAEQDENTVLHYYVDERFKISEQSVKWAKENGHQWHLYGGTAEEHDDYIRSFTLSMSGERVSAFVTVIHEAEMNNAQLEVELSAYNESGRVIYKESVKQQAQRSGLTTFQLSGLPKAQYYFAELKGDDRDPNAYNNGQFGLVADQHQVEALLISQGNLFMEKVLQLMNVGVTKLSADHQAPSKEALKNIGFIIVDGQYDELRQQAEWSQVLDSFPIWVIDHPTTENSAKLVNKGPVVHEHAITQYFSMEETYIAAVKELSSAELSSNDVLVEYGGAPVILAGIKEQKPFLRFAFSLQDSDMPLRATFPILMMQSIEYMTSGSGSHLGHILVGSEPTISLLASTSSSYWKKLKDRVEGSSESTINNPIDQPIAAPSSPGVYELVEQNEQGDVIQRRTAIVSEDHTEFYTEKITALVQQEDTGAAGMTGTLAQSNGWSSLIPWVAAVLLLLLFAEWEVYRRGL